MARVDVFQGGLVQRNDPQVTALRPVDYGKDAIGAGIEKLGRIGTEAVDRQDQIEDVKARVEANRLAIEHDEIARQIERRVKQTLGEGAEGAANEGIVDLDKGTKDILGRASPRARLLLEGHLATKSGVAKDNFLDHGFREKVTAFESSSVARINRTVESASDEEDEGKALTLLADVKALNEQRAGFFGKGADWLAQEDAKVISQFYKSRALKLTIGEDGSAHAAIEYATAHRKDMSDDDYNAVVSAYNDNALDELATSLVDGAPLPTATTTIADTDDGPVRRLDFDATWSGWYVPQEGSRYVIDNNGYGVKYGINAKAHPGENIKGMTEGRAKKIIKAQYWDAINADNLPPALAAVAFDTAVISGPGKAKELLKESGGDVDKFMSLRKSFLASLSAKDPAKYPPGTWNRRNRELEQLAARQGTDGTPLAIGPDSSLDNFRDAVMARTDIGLALKRKIIQRAEARRSDERQEREIVESEAQRDLTTSVTSLGDKFTDIKQLPQDAWLKASPATRDTLTDMAKKNREDKPLPLDVARDIGFVRTFSPEKLADPKVLLEFGRRGASQTTLRQLSEEGGRAQGALAAAKASPVERATLEALARPAFEAAGIFLWTTEAKGDKGLAERQSEAYRQEQLLSFLRDSAVTWAVNNPGKKADEATMKGWIANALRMTGKGIPIGLHNDVETVNHMSPHDREAIKQKLRSAGLPVNATNIATYYRRSLVRGR